MRMSSKGKIGIALLATLMVSVLASPAIAATGPADMAQGVGGEGASHMFGEMNYQNAKGQGTYVSFDLEGDRISNYTVDTPTGEVIVFEIIKVDGMADWNVTTGGAVIHLIEGDARIVIHDNPTAMFHALTNQTELTMSLVLGDGMIVQEATTCGTCDNVVLSVSGNGLQGILMTNDTGMAVKEVNGTTYVNITLSGDHLLFHLMPAGNWDMRDQMMQQAIADGKVKAEVSMMTMENTRMFDIMEYSENSHVQVMESARNMLRLRIHGEGNGTVALHFDAASMDLGNRYVTVMMNGAEIIQVDSLEDVLDQAAVDPDTAVCTIVDDGKEGSVYVYMPDTGATLTVESSSLLDQLLTPLGIAAIVGAVALTAGAVMVLRRR